MVTLTAQELAPPINVNFVLKIEGEYQQVAKTDDGACDCAGRMLGWMHNITNPSTMHGNGLRTPPTNKAYNIRALFKQPKPTTRNNHRLSRVWKTHLTT